MPSSSQIDMRSLVRLLNHLTLFLFKNLNNINKEDLEDKVRRLNDDLGMLFGELSTILGGTYDHFMENDPEKKSLRELFITAFSHYMKDKNYAALVMHLTSNLPQLIEKFQAKDVARSQLHRQLAAKTALTIRDVLTQSLVVPEKKHPYMLGETDINSALDHLRKKAAHKGIIILPATSIESIRGRLIYDLHSYRDRAPITLLYPLAADYHYTYLEIVITEEKIEIYLEDSIIDPGKGKATSSKKVLPEIINIVKQFNSNVAERTVFFTGLQDDTFSCGYHVINKIESKIEGTPPIANSQDFALKKLNIIKRLAPEYAHQLVLDPVTQEVRRNLSFVSHPPSAHSVMGAFGGEATPHAKPTSGLFANVSSPASSAITLPTPIIDLAKQIAGLTQHVPSYNFKLADDNNSITASPKTSLSQGEEFTIEITKIGTKRNSRATYEAMLQSYQLMFPNKLLVIVTSEKNEKIWRSLLTDKNIPTNEYVFKRPLNKSPKPAALATPRPGARS